MGNRGPERTNKIMLNGYFYGIQAESWLGTQVLETGRASLVNPTSNINYSYPRPVETGSALMNPDHPVYPILQACGDFTDGFAISIIITTGLDLLDLTISRIPKINTLVPRISERWKQGIALGLTTTVVTLVETGVLNVGTPDWADIPMGILGGIAHLGIRALSRKMVTKLSEWEIKKIDEYNTRQNLNLQNS